MSSGTQLVNMSNDIKVTIVGDSMSPTFKNGDILILEELIDQKISPGDIILFYHPYISKKKLVKRVKNITVDGNIFIEGDNKKSSSDSRSFGYINKQSIIALAKGNHVKSI
mgnify:FL=1